jgi:drug/metabolite transporter (DMT)-like permease
MNLVLLFILGTVWGASYLFIKITLTEVPALTLVAGRLTLAAVVMWAILRLRGLSMPRDRRMWAVYGVMALINAALPYSLISWGEQYIPSGLASLLQATTPIFTVLLAQVLTADERITPTKIAGVIAGFVGVGLSMLPDLRQGVQASLLGELAIIGSSLSYAGSAIYARHRLSGQPPLVSSAGQLTIGMLYMLPTALVIDQPFHISPSPLALAAWLTLTIVGTVVAYLIYFTLIERTSATFVTMVTYIIPINGLILGALALNEQLTPMVIVSLALVLLGVLLVNGTWRLARRTLPEASQVCPPSSASSSMKSRMDG